VSRARYPLTVRCAEEGCRETLRFEYDRARDHAQGCADHRGWKCPRHAHPERFLSPTNLVRTTRLHCGTLSDSGVLYWQEARGGYISGPGFSAEASDFPEGTILEVTARVILPAPKSPRPWWEYQDNDPLDVRSLPNMAPGPGDPDWQDPIDPHDLGPLSDETANDAEKDDGDVGCR
jgi:hypothetical protein